MAIAAASQMLFGQSLPNDWLDWLVLLIGIWSGLSIFQVALDAFVDQHKKRSVSPRLSGYILPGGWVLWGGLLIYGEPGPASVLLFLAGAMAMLIAVRELRR